MTSRLDSLDKLKSIMSDNREKALKAAAQAVEDAARLIQQAAQARVTAGAPGTESAEAQRLKDSIVIEHQELEAVIGTKDPAARAREFGTADAPPRAFLAPAAMDCREEIQELIGKAVSDALKGREG